MKHRYTIGAAALAFAVVAPQALGHNATVTCDPANPGKYIVNADYQQLHPVYLFGDTSVTVTWSDGYKVTKSLPTGCTPPPTPTPPPVPPVPEQTPPPVVTPPAPTPKPLTCGDLRDLYPKAGIARLKSWGCYTPPPVKPRPPLTCSTFKASHPHAGPGVYARMGLRYYACNIPKPHTPPHIAVAGEHNPTRDHEGTAVTIGYAMGTAPFVTVSGTVLHTGRRSFPVTAVITLYRGTRPVKGSPAPAVISSSVVKIGRNGGNRTISVRSACVPSRRASYWFGAIDAVTRNVDGQIVHLHAVSPTATALRCAAH